MDVLRLIPSFYPHVTGPAYQAYRISEGLVNRGWNSPILCSDRVPDEAPGYPPGISEDSDFPFNITRRKTVFSVDQYWIAPGVVTDLFQKEYDIIHAHTYHNFLKDLAYPIAKLLFNKPLVIHMHGSLGSMFRDPTVERDVQYRLYDGVFKHTLKNADAVVVSSNQEYNEVTEFGIKKGKIFTIPVGKDPEKYAKFEKTTRSDFTALFVGRLAPRRNIELLLEAANEYSNIQLEVRIVGGDSTLSGASRGDYLSELQEKVEKLGISDIVTFTGPKYGDDLIREFRKADIFVNPTHYENFGQATLEAAFAELPIFSTKTGVALDLVEEGETGEFFENYTQLADLLRQFVSERETTSKMGKKARKKAMADYQWESIIDQYMKLYREIY
ncbi:glycosyltransferase family 4 protein [Halobaculum sp. CBA1158]|uniref:glycosyltransferase family 4 protein n=1 Tax=Halobaculum sp. CBA1158 TaxID=2904243 RepID=UPI001F198F1F|nr:glycosyltransferase family 4 protein [Halobaculum sp. CBA1158]UIP01002.1 glycosyltransferase family 4 protein [Halobaculum sp. CBA1158]